MDDKLTPEAYIMQEYLKQKNIIDIQTSQIMSLNETVTNLNNLLANPTVTTLNEFEMEVINYKDVSVKYYSPLSISTYSWKNYIRKQIKEGTVDIDTVIKDMNNLLVDDEAITLYGFKSPEYNGNSVGYSTHHISYKFNVSTRSQGIEVIGTCVYTYDLTLMFMNYVDALNKSISNAREEIKRFIKELKEDRKALEEDKKKLEKKKEEEKNE